MVEVSGVIYVVVGNDVVAVGTVRENVEAPRKYVIG